MTPRWIRPLFLAAGIYDLVLGFAYFVAFRDLFAWAGVEPPNHDGYVQLPALLIAIFGLGFVYVARAPERNRDLVKLGVLMKLAFAGVVLGHWALESIPGMWIPFGLCDVVFAAAFAAALRALPPVAIPS